MSTVQTPFGGVLTAMVTPFDEEGAVDLDAAAALADHLVSNGNDGLVVNGTTGESPTTDDREKLAVLQAVLAAVGDRATIVAGVGSNDTAHSAVLARDCAKAGAHGALVVTPYYNKPPQDGLLAHFRTVADATDLPVMLYDIPGRSGVALSTETLLQLAEHPNIVANKDAKGDPFAAQHVMAQSDLVYYSGDDPLNLPLLSIGAVGFVSVVGHFVSRELAEMRAAYLTGDVERARSISASLVPVIDGIMTHTQGAASVKYALGILGLPGSGSLRLPLVAPAAPVATAINEDLLAAGLFS